MPYPWWVYLLVPGTASLWILLDTFITRRRK